MLWATPRLSIDCLEENAEMLLILAILLTTLRLAGVLPGPWWAYALPWLVWIAWVAFIVFCFAMDALVNSKTR